MTLRPRLFFCSMASARSGAARMVVGNCTKNLASANQHLVFCSMASARSSAAKKRSKATSYAACEPEKPAL